MKIKVEKTPSCEFMAGDLAGGQTFTRVEDVGEATFHIYMKTEPNNGEYIVAVDMGDGNRVNIHKEDQVHIIRAELTIFRP